MRDDLRVAASVASGVMKVVESAAVATANVLAPGSGDLVKSGFKLAKVCFQIAQVLAGMEETAELIKTQFKNIQEDVSDFKYVLNLMNKVQNQDKLTEGLQETILKFEAEVQQYSRVVNKFSRMNILKQLAFRREVITKSIDAKKTKIKLIERLTLECAIDASFNYSRGFIPSSPKLLVDQSSNPSGVIDNANRANQSLEALLEEREKEYMQFVDSPEVLQEMSDPENQREMLAIISQMGRHNDAMMQTNTGRDRVVSVMKEKLWATSSRVIRDEVSSLPDWYVTEGDVDIDMTKVVGFGGDANIYKGIYSGDTTVAVKIFNENVNRSERAKQKFVGTMKLWQRLANNDNVCRLHGACYLTKTPFVVMEYCELGPLDTFLRRNDSDRCKLSLELLAQAGQGVQKMHKIGIVHGDLKCDNILITGTGTTRQAKVCDFDRSFDYLALKNKRLVNGTAEQAGIEITDAVRYLAPECVKGQVPNASSDVYSFGMTLYHALTGESPYVDITSDEELLAYKQDGELPVRDFEVINDSAWELISQCCNTDPKLRPTMEVVVKTLKVLASKQATISSPTTIAVTITAIAEEVRAIGVIATPSTEMSEKAEPDNETRGDEVANIESPKVHDQETPAIPAKTSSEQPSSVRQSSLPDVLRKLVHADRASPKAEVLKSSGDGSKVDKQMSDTGGQDIAVLAIKPSGHEPREEASDHGSNASSVDKEDGEIKDTSEQIEDAVSESEAQDDESAASQKGSGVGVNEVVFEEPTALSPEDKDPPKPDADKLQTKPQLKTNGIAIVILGLVGVKPFAFSSSKSATTPTPTPTPVATPTPTPIPSRTSKPTPTSSVQTNSSSTQNSTGTDTITAPTTLYVRVSTIAGYGSVFSTSLGDAWYRYGLAVAANGSIYVSADHHILRLSDTTDVSEYAGGDTNGFLNGPRTTARFGTPRALAMRNSTGDLFVCDFGNLVVRHIASDGTVSNYSSFRSADMRAIALDSSDNMFIADYNSAKIIKITPAGANSTFARNISTVGIAIDSSNNIYTTEQHLVRKYTPDGTTTVLAGGVSNGYLDGVGVAAQFYFPSSLTIGPDGNLYVADTSNHCIRKINLSTANVTTYAGICAQVGSADGLSTSATFYYPMAIAAAQNQKFYVVDGWPNYQRVRKIYMG